MTNLAVIPARGGSTRLKNKNILPLGGKPLICHTIEAVINSNIFDTIYVYTDSRAIIDIASTYSEIRIYMRESSYADDKTTVLDALLHILPELMEHDTFSYFLPTCPFRNSDDIINGMNMLTNNTDFVISVSEYEMPIQLAISLTQDYYVMPNYINLENGETNSKFLEKHYHPNGGFYIAKWDSLVKYGNFFGGITKGYIMSKERSIDINDKFDLEVAECLMRKR